ncbi:MAG: ATP-binding protein [Actinobacteria bacterium]|nr:ATP-binding protein [Actinomycetota bacterium]
MTTGSPYRPRFADDELAGRLQRSGAVLIDGPKACGKTETARRRAASEVRLDVDPSVPLAMETDPSLLLAGDAPRLLDEWQEQPALWNHVRRAVDDRHERGQFILTGSATPTDDVRMHSGAGRISRMRMRPMSLAESGHSSSQVSLADLLAGDEPVAPPVSSGAAAIAELVCRGGWPGNLELSTSDARAELRGYVDLIAEVDINRFGPRRRDPEKVRRLLESLARNVATEAPVATLARDVGGSGGEVSRNTVADYLDALGRLMVVEDQPAWSTHLRSSATLRKAPKRHFVDPALAVAALRASPPSLVQDLNLLGLLFESLVIRDLRIYAQTLDGLVRHVRDSSGQEVDAVVEFGDGRWGAFQVKLGPAAVDAAARSLLRFASSVDTSKVGAPAALTVITGWGYTMRLPSGVNVVPIGALTA